MELDDIHVIAIDPGKHCGIARFYRGQHEAHVIEPARVIPLLKEWTQNSEPTILCERFVTGVRTVKKSRQHDVTDVIGAVQGWCAEHEIVFDFQSAGDAKRMGNRNVLKLLGWWTTGYETDHANDASGHLLLGIARYHPAELNKLIS